MIETAPNMRFAAMLSDGKQSAFEQLSANIQRTDFY